MTSSSSSVRTGAAAALLFGVLHLGGCGGDGGDPVAPSSPPPPTHSATATVFYDENANGQLDASEGARVPGVTVVVGAGSGTSAPNTGQAVVTGIPEGSFVPQVRTEGLPAYYVPPASALAPVTVPGAAELRIPLTLPIGSNQPSVYLGYGDSITAGAGSSDEQGYGPRLLNLLGPHFGRADVRRFGRPGTTSADGLSRITTWLRTFRPAYVLILYGTNDWLDSACQVDGPDCYTVDSLDGMIGIARDWDVLPVLATIIPVNPALSSPTRQRWVDDTNARIRSLAAQRQVLLADLNADMKAASPALSPLFADHVHPNDAGYQVIAQGWFRAISRSRSAAGASRRSVLRRP
jgi:lysophospholipase L1-like esterase